MNTTDLRIIAAQLRRTAQLIEAAPSCDHLPPCTLSAEHALEVSHGWRVPLSAAGGAGPKGDHSDPTLAAVMRGPDRLAKVHDELRTALRTIHTSAADLAGQLIGIIGTPLVAATRAGIGHCTSCNRYCDASSDNQRLRVGLCSACYQAVTRAEKVTT